MSRALGGSVFGLCQRALLVLALGVTAAGCSDAISQRVSCNTATECPMPRGPADAGLLYPECCAGYRVVSTPGCDTGYRFVTSEPEVGECAAEPMCTAGPDM